MTTDLVKYRQLERARTAAGVGLFRQLFGVTESAGKREAGFDAASNPEVQKLLRLMEQQSLENDGLNRCMSATVALLKYAHETIERAEGTIRAQEGRIALLEDLATTDDLTGLKNRRGFYEVFMSELDKCERGHSKGGLLILIDLDNFKAINDAYGHMAGDSCLRLVARTLSNEIRAMDAAARLGGDEFVLLLSNTSKECAAGRAQDLAWQLGNLSVAWYGEVIPVRASLGLRPYRAGDKAEQIFSAADIALYASKRDKDRKGEMPRNA